MRRPLALYMTRVEFSEFWPVVELFACLLVINKPPCCHGGDLSTGPCLIDVAYSLMIGGVRVVLRYWLLPPAWDDVWDVVFQGNPELYLSYNTPRRPCYLTW